jgi:hypothetical protein
MNNTLFSLLFMLAVTSPLITMADTAPRQTPLQTARTQQSLTAGGLFDPGATDQARLVDYR